MFRIAADTNAGLSAEECWSFAETADEIGCVAGDLQRSMDAIRARVRAHTGFRALALADAQKVIADARKHGALPTVTPRPGFGDLVDYGDVERAAGCGGVALADAIDRLRISVTNVECLNAEGHRHAVKALAYLKDSKPPDDIVGNAVKIADWRRSQASAKFERLVADQGARPPKDVTGAVAVARWRQQRAQHRPREPLAAIAAEPDPLTGW